MVGAHLKPFELRNLAELGAGQDLKVAASGGATTWHDAAEYMSVGATLIQICIAVMLYGFDIIEDLKEGLAYFIEAKGMQPAGELVGKAPPNIVSHAGLKPIKHAVAWVDAARCTECGRCVVSCDDGGHQAYVYDDQGYPEVDKDKCYGCGLCPDVCPADCILLLPR
mgnify:CR=1 FL=1